MEATKKENEAILECYRLLFKNATPSADFDELVRNAEENEHGEKEIPFLHYSLEKSKFEEILHGIILKYKIKGYRAKAFRVSIMLGCSPKFK